MINALRFTEELEKAGFTPEQAKKSVDTWMSLINENFATKSDFRVFQLANKSDLRELEIEIKGELREVRSDLEGKIKDFKTDIEGQIKDFKSDIEGQLKDFKSDIESQIQNLSHEMAQQSSRNVIQLGIMLVSVATIMTTVLALIK